MKIGNKTYIENHIESEMQKIQNEKKTNSVPWDYFLALVNLSKELHSIYHKDKIVDIWLKNRLFIKGIDQINLEPHKFDFNEIKGREFLKQLSYLGGIVFTFHYSYYRHTNLRIARELKKASLSIPLALVIDNESYNNENSAMRSEHEKLNIEYILAEDPKSIFKIKRILNNNGVVFIYIDGNTGSGEDSKNYTTNILNSKVNVRSGSFRLLSLIGKPFFPALANGNRLEIYNKNYVTKGNISASIDYLYGVFNNLVSKNPELWRFWYRHHKHVSSWNNSPPIREESSDSDMWTTTLAGSGEKIGLEVSSGRVYKLGD